MRCLFFQKSHYFANKSHYTITSTFKLFSIGVVEVVAQYIVAKPQLSISNGPFVGYTTFLPTSFKFSMFLTITNKKCENCNVHFSFEKMTAKTNNNNNKATAKNNNENNNHQDEQFEKMTTRSNNKFFFTKTSSNKKTTTKMNNNEKMIIKTSSNKKLITKTSNKKIDC